MQGKRGMEILEQRRRYITHYSPTKHPGSKSGRLPADYKPPAPKGNVWKAVSRPVRRYPGWKKRLIKMVEAGKFQVGGQG